MHELTRRQVEILQGAMRGCTSSEVTRQYGHPSVACTTRAHPDSR
jgi:hypothetical protein